MKKGQNTGGYQRYMALDIHREYILVGAQNAEQDWVLTPRRVSTEKVPEWAKKNIRAGDIVVLETTTNVLDDLRHCSALGEPGSGGQCRRSRGCLLEQSR